MSSYAAFLASKQRRAGEFGYEINSDAIHPMLHLFQREIVQWSVHKGRAAIWADAGLGKTLMQLEWARLSGDTSLIVAPLAVSAQTVREAAKIGITARYIRSGDEINGPGIWVTNYEMIERFDPACLDAVVLDEAGILKNSTGATRTRLIQHFAHVPFRLACTATPAPNDPEELTNQAEFLGICSRVDMLATYFIHDENVWRLKGHAIPAVFDWMATWAIALRVPSDMGDYSDDGYILPELEIVPELLPVTVETEGQLFTTSLGGVSGRARIRRETLVARCERAAELVAKESDEPWLLWVDLNDEAELLARLIPGAVNVHGSMSPEAKTDALLGFADGDIKILISKPSVCGHGMNFQHCARISFVGLRDSFESMYQAVRRCHRYGQMRQVRVHLVLSELEAQIAQNVARKERAAAVTRSGLVSAMRRAREVVS